MRTPRPALLLASALALAACGEPVVEGPFSWGGTEGVTKYGHLYFAGQPDAAALAAARDAGVEVVIDLRDPSEHDWDEAAAAEALGLAYHNVPVDGKALSRDAMERIDAIVKANHGDGILVHCASGNRAAAWLAIHLVGEHGMEPEKALGLGRQAGITKPALAENVSRYLGDSGS